ncbi:hypothetical protein BR93DRAFT_963771 [Coniochaeta sp. PMI_546]|nr:hypothetical protein BR93DRAFT_963771 [Coniochaeta sp. PMI_546]
MATALSVLAFPSHTQATPAYDNQDFHRRAASSSVVTLHLPNFDDQTILASIITANPTATSYLLTCPTDEPDDECGLGTGIKVLEGPSTLEVHMTLGESTDDVSCSLSGDTANCNQSEKGPGGLTAIATQFQGISSWAMPVTVTAGLEALTSASGSSTTTSASSSDTVSPTGSSGSTAAPTATGTGTGTGAAQSSKTSTAGMVAVTGNAVIAGVAAVFGGMLVV